MCQVSALKMIPLTTDAVNLLMPLNLSDFMRAFVSTLQPTRFGKNHFVYFGLVIVGAKDFFPSRISDFISRNN